MTSHLPSSIVVELLYITIQFFYCKGLLRIPIVITSATWSDIFLTGGVSRYKKKPQDIATRNYSCFVGFYCRMKSAGSPVEASCIILEYYKTCFLVPWLKKQAFSKDTSTKVQLDKSVLKLGGAICHLVQSNFISPMLLYTFVEVSNYFSFKVELQANCKIDMLHCFYIVQYQ